MLQGCNLSKHPEDCMTRVNPRDLQRFAPGIAGFHLGEDWECCQWLQRRNSAERLNRKIGAFGSQVSCTRISYAEIANK